MDILAGIFLLVGNIVFALGYVFISVFIFLVANIFFLLNSILLGSKIGSITILLGILTQIYVIIQMIKGKYYKDLKKE